MTSTIQNTDLPSLCHLSAGEASRLVKNKKISPVELTQACLAQIERYDGQINAFITKTADLALKHARQAEHEIQTGNYRGPLHGVPFGLKDIYETAGIRTTGHSKICKDFVPEKNATTVEKLLARGAILMGKLATHEFASGGPCLDLPWPPARNPWDTAYFTGGSSSGSAAAVAAGFVPMALGTDTGGSIRIPAAICGVAGIKPTYGLVSRSGVIPNSYSLDHCGPLAWTVEDCALVLQVIAGHDPGDPASAKVDVPDYAGGLGDSVKGVRIGVVRHFWESEAGMSRESIAALEQALEVFRSLGAVVEDATLRTRQEYSDVKMVIAKAEILSVHEKELQERAGDFSVDFLGRNLPGFFFRATDYVRAQRERRRMIEELKHTFARHDVLLTCSGTPADRLDKLVGRGYAQRWESSNIYTPFNVTGLPAIVVCNGFTETGLPLAMQLVGRPFDEQLLFRVGHQYELETRWRMRRPALVEGAAVPPLTEPQSGGGPEPGADLERFVRETVRQAGLRLTDSQLKMLIALAPAALKAVARIRSTLLRSDEPACTLRLDELWRNVMHSS